MKRHHPGHHIHRMRGFLSFLILWIINKNSLTGAEVALELEKRKGRRPSPGTIYPVLKILKDRGLLSIDGEKRYSLTDKGKEVLEVQVKSFVETFYDINEMKSCCKK